jgi:osmotically-inducible protein OsmY
MRSLNQVLALGIALLFAGSAFAASDLNKVIEKINDKTDIQELDVRMEDNKVVLEGRTRLLKQKMEAEKIARKELKKEISNNIIVSTVERSDEEITLDVVERIRRKATGSYVFDNLEVMSKGGHVTLMGQVRNAHLVDDAEEAASEVAGVKSITNKIQALSPSSADDRLRLNIYRRLRNDDRLFYYFLGAQPSINIIVNHGRVTLSGWVDTEGDRILAGTLVRQMPGILSVDNQLKVD